MRVKTSCNGSLAYGDIGFGDGELNWSNPNNKRVKCRLLPTAALTS